MSKAVVYARFTNLYILRCTDAHAHTHSRHTSNNSHTRTLVVAPIHRTAGTQLRCCSPLHSHPHCSLLRLDLTYFWTKAEVFFHGTSVTSGKAISPWCP